MAGVGAMIAAAVLKEAVQQIGSLVGGQIKQQLNFDKSLNQMKSTLESIEALLEDAEHSNTNKSMDLWLNRLTDAMYGIADMIDEFEAETGKFSVKKHLEVMMPCCTIVRKFTMANKMKKMRQELQEITDEYKNFKLVPCTNADELKGILMRETTSKIEASIIGRTEEENKICISLSESIIEDLIVIAIHGIGGLGKTTMAKMIYNNKTKFQDYVRVWIYVSQTFDLKKIGNSLISQLDTERLYTDEKDMEMIHRSLAELLANKKILIVLDDLWEEDGSQLYSLTNMLKIENGSKVIVIATTRNEEIAKEISTTSPYELALLTDEMCWTIIKQKSGFESRHDKEQLKDIGEAIAAKCGGVALAAQSIGPMLKTMTYNHWEKVRDSDIWTESASPVLASLRLSYTFMPRYLKLCFAYCAIFPKGSKISKDDLILQWISLCLVGDSSTFTPWDLGERHINKLLNRSFLEHSKTSPITFTMHDLVHDLARSVMGDEILLAGNDGNTGGNRFHYALLSDCSKSLGSRRIRALRFMGSTEVRLDGAAFASAKSLRVLDLSECSIHKLKKSIGRLKQLRYLNAPGVENKVLPNSITRLTKLLYLSLRESDLSALPESIGEMECLMYLDLSGCKRIKKLPESFGKLKKLVHVDLSDCSTLEPPESIGEMDGLMYLNLSGCMIEELPESFVKLKNLVHLDLSECSALKNISKFIWSLPDLQYLNLSRCSYIGLQPESLDGLSSLRHLNLRGCLNNGVNGSLLDRISGLSNLEHLDLSSNNDITSLPESLCNLRKLHTLDLSWCEYLQKIPENIGSIDSLKTLDLGYCHSLVEHPVPHPSTNIVSLPLFKVCVRDGESSSNLICLQDTDPKKLKIDCLENVKSAEEAQSIKLMEKNNLNILTLSWTEGAERFVDDKALLEKLVPPKSLLYLEIKCYNDVSLPTWVGQQKSLTLTGMEHLEELSVSDSSGMLELTINGCPKLKLRMSINDCPKLKLRMSINDRLLSWLEIRRSDNVLSSLEQCTMSSTGASSSSSAVLTIGILTVNDSELPMQQWGLLRHLSGLKTLSISACPDLTVSPDMIPHLSSVTWLDIQSCNISSLPHWVMDLTGLNGLWIRDCPSIRSLPEGIQQLTKLRGLIIHGCPDLKAWCESEENKMKLAHISHFNFR